MRNGTGPAVPVLDSVMRSFTSWLSLQSVDPDRGQIRPKNVEKTITALRLVVNCENGILFPQPVAKFYLEILSGMVPARASLDFEAQPASGPGPIVFRG